MGFFANILNWLRYREKPHGYSAPDKEAENSETWESLSEESSSEVMLAEYYDKHLFERARTQWQFGDWESLIRIERESLYHHPQRASLALLVAAGHQQSGNIEVTREFTRLAQDWGASKKLVSQVLISGVYNTLGKASALCEQPQKAIECFEESFRTAGEGGDVRLLTQARIGSQMRSKEYIAKNNSFFKQIMTQEYNSHKQLNQLEKEKYNMQNSKAELPNELIENKEYTADLLNKIKAQKEQIAALDKDLRAKIKAEHKVRQEQHRLKEHFEKTKKKMNEYKEKLEFFQKKLSKAESYSSDADIEDFIKDIEPFFYQRHLTYVDVGAFVGEVFCKLLETKKLKIREAHLFEPNPESFSKLKCNIERCSISSLHTYNFAIGNTTLHAKSFSSARSMTKAFKSELNLDKVTNTFESSVYSLAELSEVFTEQHINILKIDVEGSEMEVLEGAKPLFHQQKIDMVYIEVGLNKKGLQQTYFCEVDMWMQDLGYRVFKFYEQKHEWIEDLPLLRRANVAYISEKFANQNPYQAVQEICRLNKKLKETKSSKNI